MSYIKLYILIVLGLLVQSCSTNKSIFWVSGVKTECDGGNGKMLCLKIHEGENLEDPQWKFFYSSIEGFDFEEGYLKKIEVKEEKLENYPTDASSSKYTLIRELEKQVDYQAKVSGKWILTRLNDHPIDRSIRLPEMEISLTDMQVSGTSGCNNYSGKINQITQHALLFSPIISTKRACSNRHIEQDYFNALNDVVSYQTAGDALVFYNTNGDKILSYLPKEASEVNIGIHDIWIAKSIAGTPINQMKSVPRLEINLTKMKIFGNDGCNEYTGELVKASSSQLLFGQVASTRKLCQEMETADRFNQALSQVKAYRLDGLNLILLDENGIEVLSFLKGD